MATNKVLRAGRIAAALTCTAGCLALAGCLDDRYLDTRDTITLGAGDAPASNKAIHTIHPWPKNVKNTKIPGNGKRVYTAVDRYQKNESLTPKGLNTTTISVQSGPGSQTNAGIQK